MSSSSSATAALPPLRPAASELEIDAYLETHPEVGQSVVEFVLGHYNEAAKDTGFSFTRTCTAANIAKKMYAYLKLQA
jgi:hypothetical protein